MKYEIVEGKDGRFRVRARWLFFRRCLRVYEFGGGFAFWPERGRSRRVVFVQSEALAALALSRYLNAKRS